MGSSKIQKEFKKDTFLSWIVLAAGFLTQTITFGLSLCFGIYFVTLLEYFDATKSEVAIVGSITYGTTCLTGLWITQLNSAPPIASGISPKMSLNYCNA